MQPGESSDQQAPPARPHRRYTGEGTRVREVLTYTRRGNTLGPRDQRAWDAHADAWVIPDEAVDDPEFDLARHFGREAPLVVEIGSGVGEATAPLAAARPDHNVLALEVWRPGVAAGLRRLARADVDNVRFCSVDAVWFLERLVPEGGLAELWTFFPDPWPKTRHHKRRLVSPRFVGLAARRLVPGAAWRLATDWAEYATWMQEVLDAEPLLEGGVVERWAERPVTKFERKGVEAGRAITDLCYRRVRD